MVEIVVRDVLTRCGDLTVLAGSLARDADLYDAGLSSFGTVEVMVALEEAYGASFPERLLTRETFRTIASLSAAAEELRQLSPAS